MIENIETPQAVNAEVESTQLPSVRFVGLELTEGKKGHFILGVWDFLNKEEVYVDIAREQLTPTNLDKLVCENNGICTSLKAACDRINKEFVAAVNNNRLFVKNTHQHLGWTSLRDHVVFYGEKAYSDNEKLESTYSGKMDIAEHGDIEEIARMIKEQITDMEEWSALEAIIAIAVAATVLPFSNLKWDTFFNNIIIHIVGGSTTGKSTALTLFSSFGSNPEPKKGFWINFGSSKGAIIKKIGNNFGFPVVIDELSSGESRRTYEDLVYMVGNGEEKDRLTAGGARFQDSSVFSTVVLTSGEISLIRKCSRNEGIHVRCAEIVNENWTTCKEQAEKIKACVHKNYGVVVPAVAKELIANSDTWKTRFEVLKDKVAKQMQKDKIQLAIGARIMDYVALFTLSAELANTVLGVKLDIVKILKFWYEYIIINNADEANLAERAYDAIKNFIADNFDRIEDASLNGGCRTSNDTVYLSSDSVGFSYNARLPRELEGVRCTKVCVFRKSQFSKILMDAGFSDERVVLKRLNEGKYLMTHDRKRSTRKYWINGSEIDCIAIFVPEEEIDLVNKFDD